jgi:hypothetical protein
MSLPGFTAETLLNTVSKSYAISKRSGPFQESRVLPQAITGPCRRSCGICEYNFSLGGWFKRCKGTDCYHYYTKCEPPPCPPGRCVWPACDGFIGSDGQCFWFS